MHQLGIQLYTLLRFLLEEYRFTLQNVFQMQQIMKFVLERVEITWNIFYIFR